MSTERDVCRFCEKPIMAGQRTTGDVDPAGYAHVSCYEALQARGRRIVEDVLFGKGAKA